MAMEQKINEHIAFIAFNPVEQYMCLRRRIYFYAPNNNQSSARYASQLLTFVFAVGDRRGRQTIAPMKCTKITPQPPPPPPFQLNCLKYLST
uniref:Uncharacterized protein n=1 Tax=Syphacia muris TaxID=451379 RepID=A0A158R6B7_9BILA